jgi:hypothetical protein
MTDDQTTRRAGDEIRQHLDTVMYRMNQDDHRNEAYEAVVRYLRDVRAALAASEASVKLWQDRAAEEARRHFEHAGQLEAALVASEARERALREALEIYAKQENWFQSIHHQYDGYPQKVWSWNDMREPWTMAQKALAARDGDRGQR